MAFRAFDRWRAFDALRVPSTGTVAFLPVELFQASEEGAWYDPSDLSTLWQDEAGTIPVTTAGQLVARMDDKSGNDYHVTQDIVASRPQYYVDVNGKGCLLFDGIDDYLENFTDVGLRILGDVSLMFAGNWVRDFYHNMLSCQSKNVVHSQYDWRLDADGTMSFIHADASSYTISTSTFAVADDALFVVEAERDVGATVYLRQNSDASFDEETLANTGVPTTGETPRFMIGSRHVTPRYWPGNCYGALVIDRLLLSDEKTNMRIFLAAKSGASI